MCLYILHVITTLTGKTAISRDSKYLVLHWRDSSNQLKPTFYLGC